MEEVPEREMPERFVALDVHSGRKEVAGYFGRYRSLNRVPLTGHLIGTCN